MFLKKITLTNFRNLSKVSLEFSKATLFIGKNAQGKSNLLESIYFLATTKSPRAELDIQLIKQEENFARVEGEIEDENHEVTKLEVAMQIRDMEIGNGVEKRLKVNGVPRRGLDYIGNLVVVYFSPEDINLVSGSPSLRRSYIDLSLCQVDKQYKQALNRYMVALVSRNKVLKRVREGLAKIDELDFWTDQLLASGMIVADKRRHFFKNLNIQALTLSKISPLSGQFSYIYQESIISEERILQYKDREIASATSLIGPHRDDFIFMLDNRNLAFFGSRGEQRTAVLELKLSELKFISEVKKANPVLLLDDVFSELDMDHREYIIQVISGLQSIISAVESEPIPESFQKIVRVVKVEEGEIKEK